MVEKCKTDPLVDGQLKDILKLQPESSNISSSACAFEELSSEAVV